MPKIKKSDIEKLPENAPRELIRDSEVKGFGVSVSGATRTFFVEHRIKGGPPSAVRVSIGQYPAWTVEAARQKAKELIMDMDNGEDPRPGRRQQQEKPITLLEAFNQLMKSRTYAEQTRRNYKGRMDRYFADWHQRPLINVTSEMVAERHLKIVQDVTEKYKKAAEKNGKQDMEKHGMTQANLAMMTLSAVFTYAQARYGEEVIPKHAVKILSRLKQWYPQKKRSGLIAEHDLKKWFTGIAHLADNGRETIADYLVVTLLLGARLGETAALKWADISFEGRTITFQQTKKQQSRTVPMPNYVRTIFERRQAANKGSEYIFPSRYGKGHMTRPYRGLADIAVTQKVVCKPHDLRRTYITILESMDISPYAIKQLAGHSKEGDVTGAHYTVISMDRLRKPAQMAEDKILRLAGLKEADIVHLYKEA